MASKLYNKTTHSPIVRLDSVQKDDPRFPEELIAAGRGHLYTVSKFEGGEDGSQDYSKKLDQNLCRCNCC
jgi:hypothetical protein